MKQKKTKKKTIKRSRAGLANRKKQTVVTDEDLKRIEFHRHAVALLPEPEIDFANGATLNRREEKKQVQRKKSYVSIDLLRACIY